MKRRKGIKRSKETEKTSCKTHTIMFLKSMSKSLELACALWFWATSTEGSAETVKQSPPARLWAKRFRVLTHEVCQTWAAKNPIISCKFMLQSSLIKKKTPGQVQENATLRWHACFMRPHRPLCPSCQTSTRPDTCRPELMTSRPSAIAWVAVKDQTHAPHLEIAAIGPCPRAPKPRQTIAGPANA